MGKSQHFSEPWGEGESCHGPAQPSDLGFPGGRFHFFERQVFGRCLEGAQGDEFPLGRTDVTAVRRRGKGEVDHVVQVHALHLQHQVIQGPGLDLRLRMRLEIVLEYCAMTRQSVLLPLLYYQDSSLPAEE